MSGWSWGWLRPGTPVAPRPPRCCTSAAACSRPAWGNDDFLKPLRLKCLHRRERKRSVRSLVIESLDTPSESADGSWKWWRGDVWWRCIYGFLLDWGNKYCLSIKHPLHKMDWANTTFPDLSKIPTNAQQTYATARYPSEYGTPEI